MKWLGEGRGRALISASPPGIKALDSKMLTRLFLEKWSRSLTIEILMALKRPQNILNQTSHPSFIVPGKKVFLQAWNLLAFSFIFAILFNTFYSDGIELKAKPPKSSNLPAIINQSSLTPGYTGWKTSPTKTPRIRPTPTSLVSGNITRLSVTGTKGRFDGKNCLFLDARSPKEYQEGHIPGALNFSTLEMDKFAPLVMPQLKDKNQEIIAYCNGGDCTLSLELARTLVEQGYTRVEVFEGGWPEWKKAGNPVQTGETP
jgi:rhodanese-related sulfurtransferase